MRAFFAVSVLAAAAVLPARGGSSVDECARIFEAEIRDGVVHGAVVVSGSKPVRHGAAEGSGVHLYCPVIVKYRDEKTSGSVILEDMLR